MGDLRPGNGSGQPPDEGGRGLPDLPPEWGTIVIPDDPSELADEAEALRRELRGQTRRARLRGAFGLRVGSPSAIGIPLVIMAVAVLTTMISLLMVTWGTQTPQAPLPTGHSGGETTPGNPTATTPDLRTPLPDLVFTKADGDPVRLGDVLPAVLLLVDGCACEPLINGVVASAPAGVRVIAVTTAPPSKAPGAAGSPAGSTGSGGTAANHGGPAATAGSGSQSVLRIADPRRTLHTRYFSAATAGPLAKALVVNGSGTVVATIASAGKASDIPIHVE